MSIGGVGNNWNKRSLIDAVKHYIISPQYKFIFTLICAKGLSEALILSLQLYISTTCPYISYYSLIRRVR